MTTEEFNDTLDKIEQLVKMEADEKHSVATATAILLLTRVLQDISEKLALPTRVEPK